MMVSQEDGREAPKGVFSSSERHEAGSEQVKKKGREAGEDKDAATSEYRDVITSIETDLSLLLRIFTSSIHYLSNRSSHAQLNSSIPLYKPIGAAGAYASQNMVDRETMKESIEELTDDLVHKAKDIEALVERLPVKREEKEYQRELKELDEELKVVNEEYRVALNDAKELKREIDSLLRQLCDDHHATRASLAVTSKSYSTNGSQSTSEGSGSTGKKQRL